MREILFRGKRQDNGEWVVGNLFRPDRENAETQICIGTPTVRISYGVLPETVGQFTGLATADGTPVFEGDIMIFTQIDGREYLEGVVEYGEFNCTCCDGVYGWHISGGDIRLLERPNQYIRVAGNIHDNPELLVRR